MSGTPGDLLVTHIGELITIEGPGLGLVRKAAVHIQSGTVRFAGPEAELPAAARATATVIDAGGALVSPGLIEPHAHPIFAGSRAAEFDLRAHGASYADIQAAGGGILSTVRATRAASDEALIAGTLARLDRFLANGTTFVEAKSGYDLTVDGELRLLRLLSEVGRRHVVGLSPTLLAHVPDPERDRDAFVADFIARAIAEAARGGLADAVDVYCDAGAFTLAETERILVAATAAGLALRVHAEQFTYTGAAELAARLGARSVEHLEQLSGEAPALLARAGTICTVLPGAALTLKLPWPDARRMLDAGCRVALGTDCNPGSSYSESQPLMMSLACMQLGLSCEEAWLGVTRAAASAVGRADLGRLGPGARGDLVVWDADDHREVCQHYGVSLVRQAVVGGRLV
jgi:imidazolonepropionase